MKQKDPEREARIQAALEAAIPAWDEKYGQKKWHTKKPTVAAPTKKSNQKAKRVGGMQASKALKNLY